MMQAEVTGLIEEAGRVAGLYASTPGGLAIRKRPFAALTWAGSSS
jgi:hypothetical protein